MIQDTRCFACGTENPNGLHLSFTYHDDGKTAETTMVPERFVQGWQGIVHGGILMAIMDETMAKAATGVAPSVVTADFSARLLQPVKIGQPLHCIGRVDNARRTIIYTSAELYTQAGEKAATATAKMVITTQ